jgi:hypothetical protein
MLRKLAHGFLVAVIPFFAAGPAFAQVEPAAIPVVQFDKLFTLIKPQPGELRFHEIPWLIDVWAARKQAAVEGKPILVWSGAGGAPIGVC